MDLSSQNFQSILLGLLYVNFFYLSIINKTFNYFREVLASPKLLNVENRIDWKKCEQTKEDEKTDVNLFRCAFSPYNPIKD